jgi:hypothetical protein
VKNPQSTCEKLANIGEQQLKAIADYGCCAFTLLWCLGIEPDDEKAIETIARLMNVKALDEECLVYWDKCVFYLTGRHCEVEEQKISTIRNIKERTPVLYEYNGKAHWVGVENGEIAFNSLIKSVCVEKGVPTQARILKIVGM